MKKVTANRLKGGFQNLSSCERSCSAAPSKRVAPKDKRNVVVRWVFVKAEANQPAKLAT